MTDMWQPSKDGKGFYSGLGFWSDDFKLELQKINLWKDGQPVAGTFTKDGFDYDIRQKKDGSSWYANKVPAGQKKQWQGGGSKTEIHYEVNQCSFSTANQLLATGKYKIVNGYSIVVDGVAQNWLVVVKVVKD